MTLTEIRALWNTPGGGVACLARGRHCSVCGQQTTVWVDEHQHRLLTPVPDCEACRAFYGPMLADYGIVEEMTLF